MQLLILGGTRFLGRHLVEAAITRGHEITLFNRGVHNADLFPDLEKLRGDRDGQIEALAGRQWDAVIDTCGHVPRIVRMSAELLADNVAHYTYISSISVYDDLSIKGLDENAKTGVLEEESVEEITGETYGPLKALCERTAEEILPGRALIVRPGLIVGPYDPSDRFSYWPYRFNKGGEILAPGPRNNPVQIIDARDLAEWILDRISASGTGVYNATGPKKPHRFASILEECQEVTGKESTITWVDPDFLLDTGIQPWMELPLWVGGPDFAGMLAADVSKAVNDGLVFRPLQDTIRDTLGWVLSRPTDYQWRAGLPQEREREILAKWHATSSSGHRP
jgi:2'-hydroxyisoflavone reductase